MPADVVLKDTSVEIKGGTLNAKNVDGNKITLGPMGQLIVHARNVAGTIIHGARVQTGELLVGRGKPPESNATGQDGSIRIFSKNQAGGTIMLNGSNGVATVKRLRELSDLRCKTHVRPLDGSALEKTLALRAVSFRWQGDNPRSESATPEEIGFIAQDVEKIVPQAVSQQEHGYRSLSYTTLVPVLAEAIKEQQALLDEQREMLAQERERTIACERRIEDLVRRIESSGALEGHDA